MAPADVFDRAEAFLPLEQRAAGAVLLIADALAADDVVAVVRACARARGEWAPILVEPTARGLTAVPLMAVGAHTLEDVAHFHVTGEGDIVLGVADLARRMRSARHDINNPLAAALVEVQLLLMDATDAELRRALGSVQEQLRRIQVLVARLALPVETHPPVHGP